MSLPEAIASPFRPSGVRLESLSRVALAERPALFAASTVLYLLVAARLVLASGFIVPDAWSRVGNAAYVVASRDPHLAAIGFVWNPLPSLAVLPLVAVRGLWSPLVTEGFAANIISALFMAGSVVVVADIARDLRLGRAVRLAFVALFALHPMIVLYAANGMSEAPFLLFLLLATRFALRWFTAPTTSDLVRLGLALGGAYLTRYEAAAAAVAAIAIIALRAQLSGTGPRRDRAAAFAADLAVGIGPFVAVFAGWALASWIITSSAFETFTSVYGNTSQVSLARGSITDVTGKGLAALGYFAGQLMLLAPGLPIFALVAVATAAVGRRLAIVVRLAPTLILAAVLAFGAAAMVTGSSFGWLRFSITAIPLAVVVGMILVAEGAVSPHRIPLPIKPVRLLGLPIRRPDAWPRVSVPRVRVPVVPGLAAVLVLAGLAAALPVALGGMSDPRFGREEQGQLAAIEGRDVSAQDTRRQVVVAAEAAAYIDGLGLKPGSVVVDVAIGFPIVLQSRDMRTYVITPDRDFERVVADPKAFHAGYVLVPEEQGYSTFDAVGRAHPGMYENGAGMATLVRQFGDGVLAWRLYAVTR